MTTTTNTEDRTSAVTEEHVGGGAGATTPPPPPPTPTPTPPILPPAAPPRPKSVLGRLTFGVMAIALGVLALLDNAVSAVDPSARHYIALSMTVLGIGLIAGAFAGRARWLILVGVLGLPFLFGSPALEYDFQDWNSATVYQTPTSFDDLEPAYDHTIGQLVVDLRTLPWDGEDIDLDISMSIGELRILLPDDVSVTGIAEVGIGHVEFGADQSSGLGPDLNLNADGARGLVDLHASMGIGEIDIDRVPTNN